MDLIREQIQKLVSLPIWSNILQVMRQRFFSSLCTFVCVFGAVVCWLKSLNYGYIKKGFLKEWTWYQFEKNILNRERGMKFSETIQSTKNSSTWSRKTMPSCRRIRWRGWPLRGASSTTWSKNSSQFWTLFHWKVLMVIHGHIYGKSSI